MDDGPAGTGSNSPTPPAQARASKGGWIVASTQRTLQRISGIFRPNINRSPTNVVEMAQMRRKESLLAVSPNPFENRVPWTCYEVFKLLTVGPTLGVIRMATLVLSSLLGLIYAWIVTIGVPYYYGEGIAFQKEPFGPVRSFFLKPLAWLARVNCWCVGFWWVNVIDHRKPWKVMEGKRLVGGKDLLVKKMTVLQAKKLVEEHGLQDCKGFCYTGSGIGETEITFKDTYDTEDLPDEVDGTTCLHPVGKLITAAPHASLFDPFLVGTLFSPIPSAIATIDMIRGINCIVAPWFKSVGTIFIDRFSDPGKEAAKAELCRRAGPNYLGPPTMIFPEGTTTNGKVLIQFKQGAFSPGECVSPVLIRFPAKYLPISFTGDLHGASFVLRMMTQFVNHCEIEILEPYIPSPEERENDILFAANVRGMMADRLGLKVSNHTVSDSALANVGLKLGAGNQLQNDFVIKEAVVKYGFTNEMCTDFIKLFQEADVNSSGTIDRAELEKFLVIFAERGEKYGFAMTQLISKHLIANKDKALLDAIFVLINTDGSGEVTYREFIQCLGLMWDHTKVRLEGRAKMAFVLATGDNVEMTIDKGMLENAIPEEEYNALPDVVPWDQFNQLDGKYPSMVKGVMENVVSRTSLRSGKGTKTGSSLGRSNKGSSDFQKSSSQSSKPLATPAFEPLGVNNSPEVVVV